MRLTDLQEKEVSNNDFWEKFIAEKNTAWAEKKINEANYHSQLSHFYSLMYNIEECKKHAALVPVWAGAQEKTNALTSVARLLVFEKRIEEALHYYTQAWELDSEHEIAIEEAGWCCYDLKQWQQAEEWFRKGTKVLDDYEVFWEGLGLALAQQSKFPDAIIAFKKTLVLAEKDQMSYYYDHLIGQCYANLGDFYRALDHYTKSLDALPTYANSLNDIAALYYNEEGEMATAIAYLKKAEPIAEKEKNNNLLQCVYLNLCRLYGTQKEFKLQEHYRAKFMEVLGFGGLFGLTEDDDEVEDEL